MIVLYSLLLLLMYVLAPLDYSFDYCLLETILFAFNVIWLLFKDRKNEKIGFLHLFSISYAFTNYIFPLFIYPIDAEYSMFHYTYNPDVITKSTALATFAYSIFSVGFISCRKIGKKRIPNIDLKLLKRYIGILILVLFLFYAMGGLNYFKNLYGVEEVGSVNVITSYLYLLLPVFSIVILSAIFYMDNRNLEFIIYAVLISLSIAIALTGSRTLPLQLILAMSIIVIYKYKPSYKLIAIVGSLLVFAFYFVGVMRSSDEIGAEDLLSKNFGFLDLALDLIINNRNLYVAWEYVDKSGYTYGLTMLSDLLSVFPFLQGVVSNLFNISTNVMKSSRFITYLEFGEEMNVGLGTNIVGDVYMAFGVIGILFFFYSLGWFVRRVRNGMNNGSLLSAYVYIFLVSNSVYMCRSTFFNGLNLIVWGIVLSYFLYSRKSAAKYIRYSK